MFRLTGHYTFTSLSPSFSPLAPRRLLATYGFLERIVSAEPRWKLGITREDRAVISPSLIILRCSSRPMFPALFYSLSFLFCFNFPPTERSTLMRFQANDPCLEDFPLPDPLDWLSFRVRFSTILLRFEVTILWKDFWINW